jgi:hypothetical protein
MRAQNSYHSFSTRHAQAVDGRTAGKIQMAVYRAAPAERERIKDLLRVIPKGGECSDSVLDAGARDGYLSRLLTEHFTSVTALDIEKPVIAHDRINCVEGDITRLEFADNSFDVVVCAEVLEHIRGKGLERACRELNRVARSYVVIGTPYRQDIRVGRTTCQTCGRKNPPWGHVNVFDERRLAKLFLPLRSGVTAFSGPHRSRTNAISAWLMDLGGNPWGTYDQEEACLHCGLSVGQPVEQSFPQKICTKVAFSMNAIQACFVPSRPSWIHMVFRKTHPANGGPAE